MTLYYFDNRWQVASSGLPDAGGKVTMLDTNWKDNATSTTTYAELFWKVWNQVGYKLPNSTQRCYMFELVTNMNTIIVRYLEEMIVCIGCRDMETLNELEAEEVAKENGWRSPKSFKIQTLTEALEAARALSPVESEGFVVQDATFNRVKIKSPQYVAISSIQR
jgi:hypothetical protein